MILDRTKSVVRLKWGALIAVMVAVATTPPSEWSGLKDIGSLPAIHGCSLNATLVDFRLRSHTWCPGLHGVLACMVSWPA